MESVEGFLETSNAVLHYVKYGNGPSIFICFHGYGQNNTAFKKFQLNLFPESTFYSFDLFFHGKSTLLKNYTLNKIDIATLLRIFFMKEKINVKFSIIAYSLGGLLSLVCLEEFPDNISTMILLAPEGFKKNFWYSFFTFNSITRKILKIAIRNYSILFTFIKFISILKIIQKRFARYLVHNLSNQEKRERLYNTWISFRKIKFDKIQIVHLINYYKIKVDLVIVKNDKIFNTSFLKSYFSKLHFKNIITLNGEHQHLMETYVEWIGTKNSLNEK